MTRGDRVVYAADKLLFGLMEITRVRTDGYLECRSVSRAKGWPKNLIEIFGAHELELADTEC